MRLLQILAAGTVLSVTACGGGDDGGGGGGMPSQTYKLGGHTAGLVGSGLALSMNGGTPVSVSSNGAFTLASNVASGMTYNVTIATQPTNPAQTCTVTNGSGSVDNANIFSVLIFCPQAVAKFAYVTGSGLNEAVGNVDIPGTLSVYAISPVSGALSLTAGSTVSTGPLGGPLVLIPNSTLAMNVSVGSLGSNSPYNLGTVFAYSVDFATGLLTPLNSGEPYSQLNGTSSTGGCEGQGSTTSVTFTPNGSFGYVANGTQNAALNDGIWQFSWNATTGAPSLEGNEVLGCEDQGNPMTIDPSGHFAYIPAGPVGFVSSSTGSMVIYTYSINQTTGVLTQTSSVSLVTSDFSGVMTGAVVIDPYGRFAYLLGGQVNAIYAYTIDPTSGALTAVAGSPFPGTAGGITIDPTGSFLFNTYPVSSISAVSGITTYAIDPATGALTAAPGTSPVSVSPLGNAPLEIDPSGQFAYLAGLDSSAGTGGTAVYGFSIDAATGQLTQITASPFDASAGAGSPAAVSVFNLN
jgi:lactonase family protein with 7-bladed beta-propeller